MLALMLRGLDWWSERMVRTAFARAGITIDGERPWDVRVRDPSLFGRLVRDPALQLGETYVEGLWDCDAIDELVYRLIVSGVAGEHDQDPRFHVRNTWARLVNRQSRARAEDVATVHYDLDLELYERMLDPTLTYTCAYWRDDRDTLETAQRTKLAMICDKLALSPGETLLDIGCGFGGLAAYAAEHHGVAVVGITNSSQHAEVARARTVGLPVEIRQLDYRDLRRLGRVFDKIASIEMIEAVGPKNVATYMSSAAAVLADGGRFLVQAFISDTSRHVCNAWFDRYIFPNGVALSFAQLSAATEGTFGAPRHLDDLGAHYPPTLLAWDRNLAAAWPDLRRADAPFRRMWHFYLRCMAGVFRAEDLHLHQIVYVKGSARAPRRP